jgi:hypothetical protein
MTPADQRFTRGVSTAAAGVRRVAERTAPAAGMVADVTGALYGSMHGG